MNRQNIIIVLNYNDWSETTRYCKMVEHYGSVDKVVIVDNKSTDDSVEHLRTIVSEKFVLVQAEENKGYAAGNNVGLKYILDNGLKGNIIISNPDIYFTDSNLSKILEPLDDANIGITTGLITTNGVICSNYAWQLPSFWELVSNQFLGLYKIKRLFGYSMYLPYPKDTNNVICECVSGCFFCITTETLSQIGLFDERTFLYGEENILGYKIHANGQKVLVVTSEKVEHDQHHSIKKTPDSEKRSNNWNHDAMLVYVKHYLRKGPFMAKLFSILVRLSEREKSMWVVILRAIGRYN